MSMKRRARLLQEQRAGCASIGRGCDAWRRQQGAWHDVARVVYGVRERLRLRKKKTSALSQYTENWVAAGGGARRDRTVHFSLHCNCRMKKTNVIH